MSRFKLLYFVILIINLQNLNAQISDKRLCVDDECKVPVSLAKTLLRYSSPDPRILSFGPNADVTIYSKSAGSREDLWGVEINSKRGYVPKHMLRETKVLQKPTRLVDTELNVETGAKQVPSVEPDKVQEPYEVVDGTTIYLSPQEDISPSSTDSPIQTTALPAETTIQPDTEPNLQDQDDAEKEDEEDDEDDEGDEDEEDGVEASEEVEDEGTGEITQENQEQQVKEEVNIESKEEIKIESTKIENSGKEEAVTDSVPPIEATTLSPEFEVPLPVEENFEVTQNPLDLGQTTEEPKTMEVPTLPPLGLFKESNVEQEVKVEQTEESTQSQSNITEESVEVGEQKGEIANIESQMITEEKLEANVEQKEEILDVENHPVNAGQQSVEDGKLENKEEVTNLEGDSRKLLSSSEEKQDDEEKNQQTINLIDSIISSDEVVENPTEMNQLSSEEKTEETATPRVLVGDSNPLTEENVQAEDNTITSPENHDIVREENIESTKIDENVQNTVNEELDKSEEFQLSTEESLGIDPISQEVVSDENLQEEAIIEEISDVKTEEIPQSTSEEETSVIEENTEETAGPGFFSSLMSLFGSEPEEKDTNTEKLTSDQIFEETYVADALPQNTEGSYCDATSCPKSDTTETTLGMDFFSFNSDVFLYLVTTAISVIIFLFGYIAFDKNKREGPLIAKINKLEKELLIILKENQLLQDKVAGESGYETNDRVSSEVVENLKQDLAEMVNIKNALEEQVQSLEKELENSTEVGMELNKMLSEILSSESGSDVLKTNVEHLQRQLVEQQSTVNSVNETLAVTNTENHELRLELELSNKKVLDLQAELDKLLLNILKIEEEKDAQQATLESEISILKEKFDEISKKLHEKEDDYSSEIKHLKSRLEQNERKLELKTKEHDVLTNTLKQLKTVKNKESTLQNLLDVGEIKAELEVLKSENQRFREKIQQEQELKLNFEKQAKNAVGELQQLREKYDEADKLKVETQTKLEVLSNYFKDREAQWQKEISKHEALWAEKEGEATSTTERIKFMQDQLQNYKVQTESLKQEIMSQEIELKSQISVLEKKAHENWVSARQAERKLEETKQEAAQLRHRLTLRERAIQEDKNQQRLQSPIEQNGDMPISPLESPASPSLLYNSRDHITKSPALPGLPPFMPPPPGVPFMPPPIHGVPPFIPPPPPNMFPGDHRPPPLGRMSSPPLNSRYSPSSRGYSPYDHNSSSPSDSEYGTSPPHRRAYSPFNSRDREDRRDRDYKRPPPGRSNGRSLIKGGGSSGSGHSNESLEKISRQQSKV